MPFVLQHLNTHQCLSLISTRPTDSKKSCQPKKQAKITSAKKVGKNSSKSPSIQREGGGAKGRLQYWCITALCWRYVLFIGSIQRQTVVTPALYDVHYVNQYMLLNAQVNIFDSMRSMSASVAFSPASCCAMLRSSVPTAFFIASN